MVLPNRHDRCRRLPAGASVVLLALLSTAACQGPPTASDPTLTLDPSGRAPLAAVIELTTDRPAVASLAIFDGEETVEVEPATEPTTEHEVLVLGLLPDTTHTVTVTVTDGDGRSTELAPLEVTTGPLPEDFPSISVPVRKPALMEPGYTVVNVFRWTDEPGKDDKEWGAIFATDREGRVRWYTMPGEPVSEARRLRNGNLFYSAGRTGRLFEIDMLGNQVRAWHSRLVKPEFIPEGSIEVDTDTFHHDVIELANGNFLALSTEAREFEDYPADYPPSTETQPSTVIGDTLVEFTREGEIVEELKILDVLDPYRLGYGSLSTDFYEEEYSEVLEEPGTDWAHSNALVHLSETNQVMLSSNYQSLHYVIDWDTGELAWMFGDPTAWKEPWKGKLLEPVGDLEWPYHHHGVELTPHGTWILYDNGGGRAIPPNPPQPEEDRFSRVVEYRADPEAGTIEQVWSFGPEHEWFMSPFISDADWLPETGNVLITDGGRMVGPDGEQLTRFGGRNWARVLQVTHGENPEKVWELVIDDPAVPYSVYRAQHFASLYPGLDRPTG